MAIGSSSSTNLQNILVNNHASIPSRTLGFLHPRRPWLFRLSLEPLPCSESMEQHGFTKAADKHQWPGFIRGGKHYDERDNQTRVCGHS